MKALLRLYALLRPYCLRSAAPEKGGLRVVAEHALVPTMLDRAQQVKKCICVLILLFMCPDTAMYVSSDSYVCVLVLL
jgi:hypothetical protein